MAYPKSSKSALLALATAGGLWAWQNRTKLAGMLQQAQGQMQSRASYRKSEPLMSTPPAGTTLRDEPYTDATRRLRDEIERGSGEGI
jgi:hypothetical protein